MNEALHNWLRLESGSTAAKQWGNLVRLRRLGIRYDDLPTAREAYLAGLQALLDVGLAEKSGELWLWLPVRREVERKPKQQGLFA